MAGFEQIAVMVTGVGGGGLGEQIIKALRLASRPYTIVGGDMNHRSFGLKEVDYPYVLPPASDPAYLDAVLAVCRQHDVRILFPGSDAELEVMSQGRSRIDDQGIVLPINPSQVIEACLDKAQTMAFLDEQGFCHPQYREVASVQDLSGIDFLPAVLKPVVGGGGSANIFLAQTKSELELFGSHLLDLFSRFICQEYVGLPQDEYTVGVLLDLEGNLINSIAVRRQILSGLSNRLKVANRTGRKELGAVLAVSSGISQGEIGPFPQVTGPCEKLALALGCTGAVNIQCRLVLGTPYVFEINPRFSGTTSLRALVGYNEPDLLIRKHVLGDEVMQGFSYATGLIARGLKESLLGDTDFPQARDML